MTSGAVAASPLESFLAIADALCTRHTSTQQQHIQHAGVWTECVPLMYSLVRRGTRLSSRLSRRLSSTRWMILKLTSWSASRANDSTLLHYDRDKSEIEGRSVATCVYRTTLLSPQPEWALPCIPTRTLTMSCRWNFKINYSVDKLPGLRQRCGASGRRRQR
ncbi:hypothetical protein L226DRAFT_397686 [Lentinus tigrinus ALCF2SS1-7]|uniref:uncharacterized protein n=1 Tax=Lentinus tigrinus ALCF2SS1-7 TaxID=1328758 RepID=UPI0011663355|nr:hypothetical protein L226DRAFT_397686 [Lentinus tigrinus ALCF2SS1-7]